MKELNVLTLENKSCREFGEQYAKLEKAGKRTQELDFMIACITKTNNLTLSVNLFALLTLILSFLTAYYAIN